MQVQHRGAVVWACRTEAVPEPVPPEWRGPAYAASTEVDTTLTAALWAQKLSQEENEANDASFADRVFEKIKAVLPRLKLPKAIDPKP